MCISRVGRFGVCLTAFVLPVIASAQSSGGNSGGATAVQSNTLALVVVTAERRKENLQQVPVTVTALSASQLEAGGVTSTAQLSQLVPTLTFGYTAGNPQLRIRGVGTTSQAAGVENPVALYVDGVYIEAQTSAFFDLANISRIEVLAGPQGTLFGRNTTGGLVQIITPDPEFATKGAAQLSYGNYDTASGSFYGTTALTNSLAANLSVHYARQGEGYGTNLATGDEVNRLNNNVVARAKALYQISDDLQLILAGDYSHLDGSAPLTLQNVPGTISSYQSYFTSLGYPTPNHGGYYDIDQHANPRAVGEGHGLSLTGTWTLQNVLVESITAYRNSYFSEFWDLDQVPQDVLSCDLCDDRWRQVSQELKVSSADGGPLTWTAGLYYYNSHDAIAPRNVEFGADGASLFFGPGYTSAVEGGYFNDYAVSYAGYGQATYALRPDTRLTLGGRFTNEQKSTGGEQSLIAYRGDTPVAFVAPGTPAPAPGISPYEDYKNFSYRVAIDRDLTQNLLGYVSFSTGFKSGGFNMQVPTNPAYKAETLKASEAGLKFESSSHRVRANTSAFFYKYDNMQVTSYVKTSSFVTNGAASQIWGLDAESWAVIVSGLTLNGSIAYTNDHFTDYPLADYYYAVPDCNYSHPSSDRVCQASAVGNKIPLTPTTTLNFGIHYSHDVGVGVMEFTSNYYYSTGWFGTVDNDPKLRQPAYQVVNGTILFSPVNRPYRISVWTKNLLNKQYALTYIFNAGAGEYEAAPPRTFGITIDTSF